MDEIAAKLAKAQERLRVAMAALAPKHQGGEWEEYEAASADILTLERELARAQGEEYADISDFPFAWDIGAPLPHVIADDYRTFLLFYLSVPDPNWDGTYVTVKNPASEAVEHLALVEFVRPVAFRMGTPNDEVLESHPLSGKGLDSNTAQIVRNSRWITELEMMNKAHQGYREETWRQLMHYVFWFHDSTFECVAESYRVEAHQTSVSQLLTEACKRLINS